MNESWEPFGGLLVSTTLRLGVIGIVKTVRKPLTMPPFRGGMDESSGMIWSFQVLQESKSPSGPRHSVIPLLAATLSGMLTMAGQNLGMDSLSKLGPSFDSWPSVSTCHS